jgi:cytochrome d ubiquinol oxidase subunit II
MSLNDLWFIVIAFFWAGFFFLEGFDFGVGMLHSFVGKTDLEQRAARNSIGPFWDGNEVWLIVAGAATFAAFPAWYATMFSTFYLVLLLVLVALMARGVSFEYHRKVADPRWRTAWQWCLTIGSALVPLLLGTGLGDLLHGLPIDKDGTYTGSFWQLLQPVALYTGVTLTVVCVFLGATFLALKTSGPVRDRSGRLAGKVGWLSAAMVVGFVVWSHITVGSGFVPNPLDALAVLAIGGGAWAAEAGEEGWAFSSAGLGIACMVGAIFADLAPNVMISSTNAAYNITINNSASGHYTLQVMTIVAIVFTPLVLAYQGWNFYVFKARVSSA